MTVHFDPNDGLLFEDFLEELPKTPVVIEIGTYPNKMPYFYGVGEHVLLAARRGARVFWWLSGSQVRVALRIYNTEDGKPVNWLIGEGVCLPALLGPLRAATQIDFLVYRDRDALATTEDDFMNLMATYIGQ